MTGKGLPKGDHKDYSHIFKSFLPTHLHDEPKILTYVRKDRVKTLSFLTGLIQKRGEEL
jgi:hypothetical protein